MLTTLVDSLNFSLRLFSALSSSIQHTTERIKVGRTVNCHDEERIQQQPSENYIQLNSEAHLLTIIW